jgi:hypothetical protein
LTAMACRISLVGDSPVNAMLVLRAVTQAAADTGRADGKTATL